MSPRCPWYTTRAPHDFGVTYLALRLSHGRRDPALRHGHWHQGSTTLHLVILAVRVPEAGIWPHVASDPGALVLAEAVNVSLVHVRPVISSVQPDLTLATRGVLEALDEIFR